MSLVRCVVPIQCHWFNSKSFALCFYIRVRLYQFVGGVEKNKKKSKILTSHLLTAPLIIPSLDQFFSFNVVYFTDVFSFIYCCNLLMYCLLFFVVYFTDVFSVFMFQVSICLYFMVGSIEYVSRCFSSYFRDY